MKSRPDSPAILGLIGLAGLVIVGWIILTALGKTVPGEAWGLVLTLAGIVGGWVGKTALTEQPEPAPPVEVVQPEVAQPEVDLLAAVHKDTLLTHPPVRNDLAERQRISDYLAGGDGYVAGPDVHG